MEFLFVSSGVKTLPVRRNREKYLTSPGYPVSLWGVFSFGGCHSVKVYYRRILPFLCTEIGLVLKYGSNLRFLKCPRLCLYMTKPKKKMDALFSCSFNYGAGAFRTQEIYNILSVSCCPIMAIISMPISVTR